MPDKRTCRVCGTPLLVKSSRKGRWQVVCSDECRRLNLNAGVRRRRAEQSRCKCGAERAYGKKLCDTCRAARTPIGPGRRPCKYCGEPFDAPSGARKLCDDCLVIPHYVRYAATYEAYKARARVGQKHCIDCGVPISPTSKRCPAHADEAKRAYARQQAPQYVIVPCSYCNQPLEKRASSVRRYADVYCDYTCRDAHQSARKRARRLPIGPVERRTTYVHIVEAKPKPEPRTFYMGYGVACGEPVVSTSLRSRCPCEDCKAEYRYIDRKSGEKRRRARIKTNGKSERIVRRKVFERDRWMCRGEHHKGRRTLDPRLVGTPDLRAPTLDHIVPLALGGTHTYDNVQCLCRDCNNRKGARVTQTRLSV